MVLRVIHEARVEGQWRNKRDAFPKVHLVVSDTNLSEDFWDKDNAHIETPGGKKVPLDEYEDMVLDAMRRSAEDTFLALSRAYPWRPPEMVTLDEGGKT